jgi:hypothetical protein
MTSTDASWDWSPPARCFVMDTFYNPDTRRVEHAAPDVYWDRQRDRSNAMRWLVRYGMSRMPSRSFKGKNYWLAWWAYSYLSCVRLRNRHDGIVNPELPRDLYEAEVASALLAQLLKEKRRDQH